ncbi:hypothetical protein [Myroides guanonis]|uniref:Uncharacterized protein n=1 Tax=Myroides guanonis TaxID=1150112 RepID=A0A1I3Q5H5_9FLAO|nr:hypothetical protein [Myroides guanonis]SFJ29108.1 hypothetical protein SAMN04487893_10566 [Myroides guanonis]
MILNELFLEFNKSKGIVAVDGIAFGISLHAQAVAIRNLIGVKDEADRALMFLVVTPLDFSSFLKMVIQDFKLQLVLQKSNGNVCFMEQNEELRDDFKVVFCILDVVDYVYALLYSSRCSSLNIIKLSCVDAPKTVTQFWKLVRLGKLIRETLYGTFYTNDVEQKEVLESLIRKIDIELA